MDFKKILNSLKPAQILETIDDPSEVKIMYKYWRIRVAYSMYIGYIFYYLTRKNFTYAMPFISSDLNFTKAELGVVATTLYFTYGISRLVSGIISDRSNPRYFMAYGLIISGMMNICFGFTSSILLMSILWGINGFFQAWGWPPCTKLLAYWFTKKERGFWWGFIATSHNIGGALIPLIAAFLASTFSWKLALLLPGIFSIFIGLFLINRLRDIPQTLGLPKVEDFRNNPKNPSFKQQKDNTPIDKNQQLNAKEHNEKANESNQKILPIKQILFDFVLSKPLIWALGFTYFFVYALRITINDWMAYYFIEAKNLPPVVASSSITCFEIFGFFGMIIAGWGSDKLFKGNRLPLVIFSCILGLFIIELLRINVISSIILNFTCVGVLGFCIFACHMLIGIASAEFVNKQAAATSHGFITLFGYIGASFAGYPIGRFIDTFGWTNFLNLLLFGFATLLLTISIVFFSRKKYSAEPVPT